MARLCGGLFEAEGGFSFLFNIVILIGGRYLTHGIGMVSGRVKRYTVCDASVIEEGVVLVWLHFLLSCCMCSWCCCCCCCLPLGLHNESRYRPPSRETQILGR